jgi:hypothetical protein
MAPYYLDVFIVHVKEQNSKNMVTLWTRMHSHFQYMHNPLYWKRDLKTLFIDYWREKGFTLNIFTNKGQWTCPLGTKPTQWERLMKYWVHEKTIVKASTMCNAQGNKKNVHKYGRPMVKLVQK